MQPGRTSQGWLLISGLLGSGNVVFQSREGAAPPTLTVSVRRCNEALCDDGNSCTADLCDEEGLCVNEPLEQGAACNDGDACTVGELCGAESCLPGELLSCGEDALISINEVESSGGMPGDWIELFNAGAQPVDVSDWC